MSSGGIVGIVLVAGKAERMAAPVPKQLLSFGGQSMASLAVANAEASRLDRVVAVTGNDGAEVAASLGARRAVVVDNPDYERGNVTSLLRGVEVAGDADAILLLLGDMPGVTPTIIDRFVDLWHASRPWAAVAVYDDGVANHPFLLSAAALDAMAATDGSKVLWRLLVADPPAPVTEVHLSRPAPIDVDTMDDYRSALRQLGLEPTTGEQPPFRRG